MLFPLTVSPEAVPALATPLDQLDIHVRTCNALTIRAGLFFGIEVAMTPVEDLRGIIGIGTATLKDIGIEVTVGSVPAQPFLMQRIAELANFPYGLEQQLHRFCDALGADRVRLGLAPLTPTVLAVALGRPDRMPNAVVWQLNHLLRPRGMWVGMPFDDIFALPDASGAPPQSAIDVLTTVGGQHVFVALSNHVAARDWLYERHAATVKDAVQLANLVYDCPCFVTDALRAFFAEHNVAWPVRVSADDALRFKDIRPYMS